MNVAARHGHHMDGVGSGRNGFLGGPLSVDAQLPASLEAEMTGKPIRHGCQCRALRTRLVEFYDHPLPILTRGRIDIRHRLPDLLVDLRFTQGGRIGLAGRIEPVQQGGRAGHRCDQTPQHTDHPDSLIHPSLEGWRPSSIHHRVRDDALIANANIGYSQPRTLRPNDALDGRQPAIVLQTQNADAANETGRGGEAAKTTDLPALKNGLAWYESAEWTSISEQRRALLATEIDHPRDFPAKVGPVNDAIHESVCHHEFRGLKPGG